MILMNSIYSSLSLSKKYLLSVQLGQQVPSHQACQARPARRFIDKLNGTF